VVTGMRVKRNGSSDKCLKFTFMYLFLHEGRTCEMHVTLVIT